MLGILKVAAADFKSFDRLILMQLSHRNHCSMMKIESLVNQAAIATPQRPWIEKYYPMYFNVFFRCLIFNVVVVLVLPSLQGVAAATTSPSRDAQHFKLVLLRDA